VTNGRDLSILEMVAEMDGLERRRWRIEDEELGAGERRWEGILETLKMIARSP